MVNDAPVSASAEAEYANEDADETEKPSTSATDNAEAANDEAAATDDSTGIAKPDSWWEELKNRNKLPHTGIALTHTALAFTDKLNPYA